MTEVSPRWRAVWLRKGRQAAAARRGPGVLAALIKADGWDTGAGRMSVGQWRQLVRYAWRRLGLRRGMSLLEVGCGAGPFLLPIAERGVAVSGVDYSPTLVRIARRVLPPGSQVRQAEAKALPFADAAFDRVASNGVFLYFPNWAYTERALDEIVRVLKPGGAALITDLNDRALKRQAEAKRRANLGAKRYRELYRGLGHLYFRKEWFERYARRRGLEATVLPQAEANPYGNSEWRFMLLLRKPLTSPSASPRRTGGARART